MKTASDMKEQRHMAAQPEPIVTDLERLAECGFTAEESAALLWLRGQKWQASSVMLKCLQRST